MNTKKNINDEIRNALESCAAALSLPELSRETGVRLNLLNRAIARSTRDAKKETWDKIYPVLKPYLLGPEPEEELPPRIGPAYRRHKELVDMFSDQKVLLDVFCVLDSKEQTEAIKTFEEAAGSCEPTAFTALTADENRIMGAYLATPEEKRDELLLELVEKTTVSLQEKRKELF
ncbi:MAG: hypothetical protein IJZ19_09365 [Lentisphaeria bacterium]|nr:hypothetical protein [Lentisphaeria bacterium]MBQ8755226.1 hypothetical protein [Lentisphaeria bacterium]MBQ9775589.1 hypothetical protein [Lentisphaeria bacterium]